MGQHSKYICAYPKPCRDLCRIALANGAWFKVQPASIECTMHDNVPSMRRCVVLSEDVEPLDQIACIPKSAWITYHDLEEHFGQMTYYPEKNEVRHRQKAKPTLRICMSSFLTFLKSARCRMQGMSRCFSYINNPDYS